MKQILKFLVQELFRFLIALGGIGLTCWILGTDFKTALTVLMVLAVFESVKNIHLYYGN